MSYPVMNIVHQLPGRVRISLSMPPRRIEKLEKEVLEHTGIHCVKFSPITRSVLVYYNPIEIEMPEIIVRIGTALSIEYNMCPVYVENKKNVGVNIIDNYALGALIAAWIGKSGLLPLANIANLLEWNAGISTLAAVINHGISEIKISGTPDPEVVTAVYLLNSMLKREFLISSTITWISTFIRHLTGEELGRISIQAFQAFSQEENRMYYDVAVKSEENLYHKSIINISGNMMRKYVGIRGNMRPSSFLNQIKRVSDKHGDALEGLRNKKDIIFLRLEY
ncbi:hypothetical protein [Desulfosporosinus shakirovi]|uniref:hypothetical protein n=1 Tax=Desulfosporosinus shakirovi TaxID=2885154 RepID=UPI001E4D04EC|nr:hypothetical protein [Desulfosporosinus sp. SRJS8]MCB8815015.1 hypothetical protein [Desulfosporosinus sp. SRJS8]